jgi:hypothetical protein
MSVNFYAAVLNRETGLLDMIRGVEGPNWANANARAMLNLLEFPLDDECDLTGQMTLPEARQAFIRTKTSIDRLAKRHTRETVVEDRFVSFGLDQEGIKRRLQDFGVFLDKALAAGAKFIYWA